MANIINCERVLGIKWDVGNDEFVFSFKKITELAETLEVTKRNILRISATFNDALGFFSPITARVKSIFQLLCKWKKKVGMRAWQNRSGMFKLDLQIL